MRKFSVITLVLVLIFTFTACGRRDETPIAPTPSAPQVATEPATLPTIDPTMGTNIPDPEVDTSMPDMMDPTSESGAATDESGSTGNGNASGNTSGQTGTGTGN